MEAATKIYSIAPDVARRAKEYMEKTGLTITEVAKEINYHRSSLSKYLNGKHNGDSMDIEARLAQFLSERTGESITPSAPAMQKPQFFESRDASQVIGVCSSCQEFTGLGLMVGKSGYGKSHTMGYFAKMPRVAYVECDDTMGCRDLVDAIEKALGIPSGYGTIWKRVNGIKEFFNVNKGYLLIVDEADKLISKYTQKKMEILRAIFDQADVGLVIAGEPKLESQIKGYLARFANRVDFYYSMKGLSQKEVLEYLKPFPFTDEALQEMYKRATNSQTGCFRLLDRTLNNIIRLMDSQGGDGPAEITLDIIAQASDMMML
jgi:DNA transposition AAA+ family ATPase